MYRQLRKESISLLVALIVLAMFAGRRLPRRMDKRSYPPWSRGRFSMSMIRG